MIIKLKKFLFFSLLNILIFLFLKKNELSELNLKFNIKKGNILERGVRGYQVNSPCDLVEAVLSEGRKGLQIQRYKGLGEMNADQLWDTTLDPDSRRLLKVKVDEGVDNSEVFSDLMGDEVIKRREFIQESISSGDLIVNLDI